MKTTDKGNVSWSLSYGFAASIPQMEDGRGGIPSGHRRMKSSGGFSQRLGKMQVTAPSVFHPSDVTVPQHLNSDITTFDCRATERGALCVGVENAFSRCKAED